MESYEVNNDTVALIPKDNNKTIIPSLIILYLSSSRKLIKPPYIIFTPFIIYFSNK